MGDRISAWKIIKHLQLEPLHFEGGYFRRTFTSARKLGEKQPGYPVSRPLASAIYYLLDTSTYSRLHFLPTEEILHFYLGDPVDILMLHPQKSKAELQVLGNNLFAGEIPQLVLPAGCSFGMRIKPGGDYCLMGATLSPAFADRDFRKPVPEKLFQQYPGDHDLIKQYL